jgi:hypothetical protein
MVALLPNPEQQFCDENGTPYAGGTIETYVPATTTPKATWMDEDQSALNTNPVILDAAGRCLMYGDGDYRLILRDALGSQIWDQPSSTFVSAAMEPVITAPTIADAVALLGIDDLIATEAAARAAADSAETSARVTEDTLLQNAIAAEVTRAEAAETGLQTQIDALPGGATNLVQGGQGDASSGHVRITYPTPYGHCISCVATVLGSGYTAITLLMAFDDTGADIYVSQTGSFSGSPAAAGVVWMSIGTV